MGLLPKPKRGATELERYQIAFPKVPRSLEDEAHNATANFWAQHRIPEDEVQILFKCVGFLAIAQQRRWAGLK